MVTFTLKDFLFVLVKLTKNADSHKYSYSTYSIGFNSHSLFLIQKFYFGKNVLIFGVDNSSFIKTC